MTDICITVSVKSLKCIFTSVRQEQRLSCGALALMEHTRAHNHRDISIFITKQPYGYNFRIDKHLLSTLQQLLSCVPFRIQIHHIHLFLSHSFGIGVARQKVRCNSVATVRRSHSGGFTGLYTQMQVMGVLSKGCRWSQINVTNGVCNDCRAVLGSPCQMHGGSQKVENSSLLQSATVKEPLSTTESSASELCLVQQQSELLQVDFVLKRQLELLDFFMHAQKDEKTESCRRYKRTPLCAILLEAGGRLVNAVREEYANTLHDRHLFEISWFSKQLPRKKQHFERFV